MILYDKKCNFLGIAQTELSLLGYEDIEEFKSYHDDFADLFEERPGYLFKFKNFSWIDYSLHSGAPNKGVVLKHKNGTLIEAKLEITEIFLNYEINSNDIFYAVEILDTSLQKLGTKQIITDEIDQKEKLSSFTLSDQQAYNNSINTDEETFAINSTKNKDDDFIIKTYPEKEESKINTSDNLQDSFHTDINNEKAKEEIKHYYSPSEYEKDSDNNLSINNKYLIEEIEEDEIFHNSTDIDTKDNIEQNNSQKEPEIKLKVNKDYIDYETIQNSKNNNHSEYEFDFAKIAEETGLELSNIAVFLNEFILESKQALINIKNSSDIEIAQKEIIKIKGIATVLKLQEIVSTLKNLSKLLEDRDTLFSTELNNFEKHIKNLEGGII